MWESKWAGRLEQLQAMQDAGMEVRALKERPKLNPDYYWLYEAYHLLSPSRQLGSVGEYYIPLTEYEAYFNIVNLTDVEQRSLLVSVITKVDGLLLQEKYKETTKK